jgi:hypothetical protein
LLSFDYRLPGQAAILVRMPGHSPQRPKLVTRLGADSGAGQARGLLRVWAQWERIASTLWRAEPVPGSPHGSVRFRFTTYHGKPVDLPDGTRINPGDAIAEMHLNNRVVSQAASVARFHILVVMKADLHATVAWLSSSPGAPPIKAVHAVTILGRGAEWLGFVRVPRPINIGARLQRLYFAGLVNIYVQGGLRQVLRGSMTAGYPEDIWISRRELERRFG